MSRHIMIVPADRGGCGYFRLIWPGQAVAIAKPEWTVSIVPPEKVQAGFRDGKFIGVQGFPDPLPDILVMQRVGTPAQYNVMKWASDRGVATILDFDDAMWTIDKNNTAWSMWNLPNDHKQHWRWCDDAAKIADVVTVTTDALARRYGKHGRVEIINNYIPSAVLDLERHENEVVTAGWSGFTRTHPGDCQISKPAAHAILEAGGELCVIADAAGAAEEWNLDVSQIRSIPPQRLGPQYFSSLSNLDLMLVGLRDTPFNRAKSTLKALEAGAAGAYSIASDNPPHRLLQRSGFPITLASTPSEWADAAKKFAAIPADDRRASSHEIVEFVREKWTIEANASRWIAAWERAMRRKEI